MTITFSTTRQRTTTPRSAPLRRLLVHGTRVRRLDQARPRRARCRRHDLGPGRRLPGRDRHVRGRGPGRRASSALVQQAHPTWTPRTRARRARRHGDAPWAATATARLPVEAQGGGAVNPGRERSRPWSSPSRRRWRSAWRAQPRSRSTACSRSRTRAARPCTSRSRSSRDGGDDGDTSVALRTCRPRSRDRSRRERARAAHAGGARPARPDDRDRRLDDRLDRGRRHAARALGARRAATTSRPA